MQLKAIDEISTEDLLNELENRFGQYIFCGTRGENLTKGVESASWYSQKGDRLFLISLCEQMKSKITFDEIREIARNNGDNF